MSGGHGVLGAVEAAVRAGACSAEQVVARLRPVGAVSAADVEDALACLAALGAVRRHWSTGWVPGAALAELPVPLAEVEAQWRRERGKRMHRGRAGR